MFLYVWLVMLVVVATYMTLVTLINRRIRFKHVATWEAQGRPTFWNNSAANAVRFLSFFIFSARYRALSDLAIDYLVLSARTLPVIGLSLFALTATLILTGAV